MHSLRNVPSIGRIYLQLQRELLKVVGFVVRLNSTFRMVITIYLSLVAYNRANIGVTSEQFVLIPSGTVHFRAESVFLAVCRSKSKLPESVYGDGDTYLLILAPKVCREIDSLSSLFIVLLLKFKTWYVALLLTREIFGTNITK